MTATTTTTTTRRFPAQVDEADATWTIDDLAEAEGSTTPEAMQAERDNLRDAWAGFDVDAYTAEYERRYDAGAF